MFAATTDELVLIWRREVDDKELPYLWSDEEAYQYMTEAVDKTAKATLGVNRVLHLQVYADDPLVMLPPHVLHINSALLSSASRVLQEVNADELVAGARDYGACSWVRALASNSKGIPRAYLRDYERCALRLIPTPIADETLDIQCSVTTATPMTQGVILPFRDSEDLRLVLLYMKKLAYEKQDVETFDARRVLHYSEQFDRTARVRKSEVSSYRRAPGVVAMDW